MRMSRRKQLLLLVYVDMFHKIIYIYFVLFLSEGSNLTPAHHFPDFRLKTYAPLAFRYFRELFGIKPDDYLVSVETLTGSQLDVTILIAIIASF